MRKSTTAFIVTACSVLCSAFPSGAEDGKWDFKVAPYLWTMGISGDIGPAIAPAEVNMRFDDIVSMADIGFTIFGEATYEETWTLLGDFMYIDLSEDGTLPTGDKVAAENEMGLITLAGAYRASEKMDLYLGGRWISLDSSVGSTAGPSAESSTDFIDPIIGLRLVGDVDEKTDLKLAFDIGGFGVNADFTWHLLASIHYDFTKTWSGILGYRVFDIDYNKDRTVMDLTMQGLLFGVGINF